MKFSTRDRYALRLMVELANRPNDLIPLKEISDKQRISLKYLEQIVTPLAKAGLVSSVRGAQGGYRLARSAAEITSRRLYKLHRVRLFSPALCRVNRGSKIIVQGASQMQATPQQLIILPADVELEVINQPDNGRIIFLIH